MMIKTYTDGIFATREFKVTCKIFLDKNPGSLPRNTALFKVFSIDTGMRSGEIEVGIENRGDEDPKTFVVLNACTNHTSHSNKESQEKIFKELELYIASNPIFNVIKDIQVIKQ